MNESRTPSRPDFCRSLPVLGGALGVCSEQAVAQDSPTNQPHALAGAALRYPEKTFFLGQVFKDTTNSYKLVWFLAILSLIKRGNDQSLRLADIFMEMAVAAWHPVCLYRLSLGRQDKLQHVVLEIQEASGLPPNVPPDTIRKFVEGSAAAQTKLDYFKRYVPTRFLSPWFAEKLGPERNELTRTREIQEMAIESQKTPYASPYHFEGTGTRRSIRVNDSWRWFLMENFGIVQSFSEHHLALYLQARNPNVPGVVNKLRAPTARQLTAARDFWRFVRTDFERAGKPAEFRDIYSERQLGDSFSIDHFLPWSFVVHDLLWNLTPVEPATNSSKNDVLPDLDLYIPRLAKLHFAAMDAAKKKPRFLEDYADCFKKDAADLLGLGEKGFAAKYREVILPQAQIATNQGFQSGWRMRLPVFVIGTQPKTVNDARPIELSATDEEEPIPAKHIIDFFPIESRRTPGVNCLPFLSLKVAAGGLLGHDAPEPEGWIDVAKHGFSKRLSKGMFVTQVVGESMYPTIRDGSYCVFRSPVEGTRQGRIVLVQKRDMADPETGGAYTVKRYRSTKSNDEDGWSHESIQLIPDNSDREKFPVLVFTPKDDVDLCVIAEFIQMLTSIK